MAATVTDASALATSAPNSSPSTNPSPPRGRAPSNSPRPHPPSAPTDTFGAAEMTGPVVSSHQSARCGFVVWLAPSSNPAPSTPIGEKTTTHP
jgi:hypothetical protein